MISKSSFNDNLDNMADGSKSAGQSFLTSNLSDDTKSLQSEKEIKE